MKLVHAADLHIDSPQLGLSRHAGAPQGELRGATRVAMKNLMDLCLSERADLLLLAGDVFDGDWKDYSSGLFFCAELARLREVGTRVVTVRGNHDAASSIAPSLRYPSHVLELSAKEPETRLFEELGVAVHGQSFPRREVTEDLARRYPDPRAGYLNIGLLHTAMAGSEHHEPYAPCSRTTLEHKGYQYWALGHVHRHEIVSTDPWIVYPGNLQGRHARETGPKGAVLVECDDRGVSRVEHRALDVVRWARAELDVTGIHNIDDLLAAARRVFSKTVAEAEGRLCVARVRVAGQTSIHRRLVADQERWRAELAAAALDVPEGRLWIERVEWRTSEERPRANATLARGAIGQVLRSFEALKVDPARRAELLASLSDLETSLPSELRSGPEPLRLRDDAALDEVLSDVREIVLGALLDSALEPGHDAEETGARGEGAGS